MPTIFGLDFGTTNSALSINDDGKVMVIDIDKLNSDSKNLRSVLYFDEYGHLFIGHEAMIRYVENDAHGRYIQSMKSFLPDESFIHTTIYGKFYEIDDLVAIILLYIKKKGEEFVGREVPDVLLGRPVLFSTNEREDKLAEKRLESAAKKAGFKNVYFQYEPIAAALSFEKTLRYGEEQIALIGDFGGGTSDFSIINLHGGKSRELTDRKSDVLALNGVSIGGNIFDSEIMWEKVAHNFGKNAKIKSVMGNLWQDMPPLLMRKIRQWHQIPLLNNFEVFQTLQSIKLRADDKQPIINLETLIRENYGYMLFTSIEKSKCELSTYQDSVIKFKEMGLVIEEHICRSDFERIISEQLRQISECIDSLVADAGLNTSQINSIFLTGGSSYIHCIRDLFEVKFGSEKVSQVDVFTSVAYGLGVNSTSFI